MSDRPPRWLPDKSWYQDARRAPSFETNAKRGMRTIGVLQEYVLPFHDRSQPLRILEVGPGLDATWIRCPYEPYAIAALLERNGVPYEMAIVDKDAEVIADIQNRRQLCFLQRRAYSNGEKEGWNRYLSLTNQNTSLVHEHFPNIIFQYWVNPSEIEDQLDRGVKVANIPLSFQNGLRDGGIVLLNGDIAIAPIADLPVAPYDFINALFVFSYLSVEGQQLALYNLAQSMRVGANLFIDNFKITFPRMTSMCINKWGSGWATEKEFNDLGLNLVKRDVVSEVYEVLLLKKG